jgi:hypothetical protein
MADTWCAFEQHYFPSTDFRPYEGGPRELHEGREPSHTSDGLEIGHQAGPLPGFAADVLLYGAGPMADGPAYGAGPMGESAERNR